MAALNRFHYGQWRVQFSFQICTTETHPKGIYWFHVETSAVFKIGIGTLIPLSFKCIKVAVIMLHIGIKVWYKGFYIIKINDYNIVWLKIKYLLESIYTLTNVNTLFYIIKNIYY